MIHSPSSAGKKGNASLAVDGASLLVESTAEVHSDCDSEGNEPPTIGQFINPLTTDEITAPAKGALQDIKLPFYQAKEARRLREAFEPPISYEDWVDADDGGAAPGGTHKGGFSGVRKLEDDDDLPMGPRYGWHAFCPPCNVSYHPLVPSQWRCIRCEGRVWQQPSDPESRHCAICAKEVARNRKLFHMKVYNPLSLNPHVCKRCGRIVCDHCYSPVKADVAELGWEGPQRVCTECELDLQETRRPPPYEDYGTLHDESAVHAAVEIVQAKPYWPPRCASCNVTAVSPTRKWACKTCGGKMWQPATVPESLSCWMCGVDNPEVRCHRCGQMACERCGAYAQPLPELGFDNGAALTVCKCCYGGYSLSIPSAKRSQILEEEAANRPLRGTCSKCKSSSTGAMWLSTCHKAPCWQMGSSECAVCAFPLTSGASSNCRRCGMQVCVVCAQYKEPVPDRGYPPDQPQTVCRACFSPKEVYSLDLTDHPHWPPRCPVCLATSDRPPSRWRCPNECGSMWQPAQHVASQACYCCGKSVASSPVNCRKCGRVVCEDCGSGRSELVEMGFTRGMQFPTCKTCLRPPVQQVPASSVPPGQPRAPSPGGPGKKFPPPGAFPGKKFPPPGAFPGKKFPPPGAFPGKKFPPPGAFPGKKAPPPGGLQRPPSPS